MGDDHRRGREEIMRDIRDEHDHEMTRDGEPCGEMVRPDEIVREDDQ